MERRSVTSGRDSIERLCAIDYGLTETYQTSAPHPSDLVSDTYFRADSDRGKLAKPSAPPLKLMFDQIKGVLAWVWMPLQEQTC